MKPAQIRRSFVRKLLAGSIVFVFLTVHGFAQNISGLITDEQGNPVSFANVFVRELSTGTSTDDKGYYFLTIDPGVYNLVYSSIGYHTKTIRVIITDKPLTQHMVLPASTAELDEIVVKASRKDPAYEIIQQVIANREKYLSQVKSARTNVYLRATEVTDTKARKSRPDPEASPELSTPGPPADPFAAAKTKQDERLQNINLVEMQLTLNFQYPGQYKEERTGFKTYGSNEGLFIPLFSESDFNFYHNLVNLKGISEVPLISPVSKLAVLSYKYKLDEVLQEGKQLVYKIRVIPRKTGDATAKGHLYINDSTWNINRLELTLEKGALKFYDAFTIRQNYQQLAGDVWIPARQEFLYHTRAGAKTFQGHTVWVFTDYQKAYAFPPRFFGNEVSVTTREAYQRDSTYWNTIRAEPLSADQQKVIAYRDSIEAAHTTQAYLDSVEAQYNKITLSEILYHGVGFRKEARKSNIYISSLLNLINFEVIGGFRLGPYLSYFRRFDDGRRLHTAGSFTLGLRNRDWQGDINLWTRYAPHRLGDLAVRAGRSFYSINSFDAYLNQLRISNYILHEHVDVFHRIELLNGLYLSADLGFHNRHSVEKYNRRSIINEVIKEDSPLLFESYQALISQVRIAYTPRQRYMREPDQKVVLGSRYPTFSISHRKGWNGVLSSDIDFDYLEAGIEQNLILGTLGNSRYAMMAGTFVNTRDLRIVDLKRFRQSDPYLYSDPLRSFQLLDTALSATNVFLEAHYIHHFNGAMINNLPLIKKTKIRTVAGAGIMWIRENNYRYQEVFGGIERIFKLGARRRLRLGLYGVLSQTNQRSPATGYKISFDIIDTWKRDWSY